MSVFEHESRAMGTMALEQRKSNNPIAFIPTNFIKYVLSSLLSAESREVNEIAVAIDSIQYWCEAAVVVQECGSFDGLRIGSEHVLMTACTFSDLACLPFAISFLANRLLH